MGVLPVVGMLPLVVDAVRNLLDNPGIVHLPALADVQITWNGGLLSVLFPVLLLPREYHQHVHSEPKKYAKRLVPPPDLRLHLAMREHVRPLGDSRPWGDRALFNEEFQALCLPHVKDFTALIPKRGKDFYLWVF